ncbi:NAD-dependent epimerase/dehydratase family protein [Pseudofulvibacter geojedonensis]
MILVTGGTGLVGSHLLYYLTQTNDNITAIYRNDTKRDYVKKIFGYYTNNIESLFNKIKWIKADLTDVPALEKAFDKVSIVYHCAANISFNPKDYQKAKETNHIGTANIVNLCLAYNISKLCHISSIATLDEPKKGLINESAEWSPEKNKHNIYAITKYNAELEVWRGSQEGLNTVIINPGLIIGPGFWNSGSGKIFKMIHKGFNYYTKGSIGVIDINDLIKSIIFLTNSQISNKRFILVSDNINYQKLISSISINLGIKKSSKEVSEKLIYYYYLFDKLKSSIGISKRQVFKPNTATLFKKLEYNNSKIKNTVDFHFRSFNESILKTTQLFLKDFTKE